MPSHDARSPADVLSSIKNKSDLVKAAADDLSARINWMQDYLASIPGRVETFCHGTHPDHPFDRDMTLVLRLHRDGKEWVVSYDSANAALGPDDPENWRPLVDAPIKIKLAALKMFPDVLVAIEKSQDRLAQEMREASEAFDKFTETLKKSDSLPTSPGTSTTAFLGGVVPPRRERPILKASLSESAKKRTEEGKK